MPTLLAHHTVPSLIHGDLWSGNYMYTASGPALIDPACSYADREMELGMMQVVWRIFFERVGSLSGRVSTSGGLEAANPTVSVVPYFEPLFVVWWFLWTSGA